MATKKQTSSVREALALAGDMIEVGACVGGTGALVYSLAKTAAGIPIILSGLSVVALAILFCLLVLLMRGR
jgi:hypothetical protein